MTISNIRSPKAQRLSWVITVILIAAGLAVMVWLIGQTGVGISWKDQRWYFRSGLSLAKGLGFTVPVYYIADDTLEWIPLTHYPPLVSTLYAAGIRLGAAPEAVPGIVNLIAWGFFLVGSALLSVRVAQRASAAIWGTALVLLSWPYWNPFQGAVSEPVFYPLLVWFAYFLTDSRHRNRVWWWAITLTLLTLLLLTRYVAIYISAGVVLWWTLVRWREVTFRRLIAEWFLWGLPALPLGVWLIRNWVLSGHLFGPGHVTDEPLPFTEALPYLVKQSLWIIFPSVRPVAAARTVGLALVIGVGLALLVIALISLRNYPRWLRLWHPLYTPLPILILAYMSVFTVFSFTLFYPITERYMAVTLALLQPLIIGSLVLTWPKHSWVVPASYTLLHTLLLLAIVGTGLGWIKPVNPPAPPLPDPAGFPVERYAAQLRGVPTWLLNAPPRTLDRSHYLVDVDTILDAMPAETALISNAPALFIDHPIVSGDFPVRNWLEAGTCSTQYPTLVAIVEWDQWLTPAPKDPGFTSPDALNEAIQAKCPDLEPVQMQRATLYHLGPSAAVQSE